MDEVDYLKAELDNLRYREEQRIDNEIQARKERDRERNAVYEEGLQMANDWPEALQNQMVLMGREVSLDEDELDNWLDNWFVDGKRACERALELWREVAASKQERIAQLRQELDSIQDEIRLEVVARLNDESQRPGWKAIGNLLAEGDLDTFLHW